MPPGFTSADFYYLLPEIVLTAGSLLVLVLDASLPRRQHRVLSWVTVAVLAATGLSLLPGAGENLTIARGLLAIDDFGLFFKALFILSAGVTIAMSPRYLALEGVRVGEYCFLILCATLGMMIMASGIDLITIFIGLETMAVSFYVLVGYLRPNRRSNEAAIKYFLLGAFSLGILLYGMSLLYGLTGSTQLRAISTSLFTDDAGLMLPLAVMLLVAGV